MSTTLITEGNLTADPELRTTKNGKSVTNLRLAVNTRRRNETGDYEDTAAVFYEVTVWGGLADNAVDSLRKGDAAIVSGRAYDETWTDRDNNTRTRHVIQADLVGPSLRFATAQLTKTSRRNGADEPAE